MSVTIAAALDAYVADRRDVVIAAARLTRGCRVLRAAIGDTDASDRKAVAAAVQAYSGERRSAGRQSNTIRRELIVLRAALMMAWKNGEIADRPYVALPAPAPGRQRWLTAREAQRLIAAAAPHLRLFIWLGLLTGARPGAIIELTWDRIDLRRGIIDFRLPDDPQATRRKRRAVVPIAPRLMALLRRTAKSSKPRPPDRVVPLSLAHIERLVRTARAAAQLDGVTPHVLRHTAATWMLSRKVPLIDASRMLGHASTLITEQVCGHLVAEALRPAAAALAATITDD